MPRQVHTVEYVQHPVDHRAIGPEDHDHVAEGGWIAGLADAVKRDPPPQEEDVGTPHEILVDPVVVHLHLQERQHGLAVACLPRLVCLAHELGGG